MHKMAKVIEKLPGLFFGEWIGVQVFMFPMLVHYWFNLMGLQVWIKALLSYQVHYFPITLFVFLFFCVLFILIKQLAFLETVYGNNDRTKRYSEFFKFIFLAHKGLLVMGFALMLVYILGAFMKYFYKFEFPVRLLFYLFFQWGLLLFVIGQYLVNTWLSPYLKTGASWIQSYARFVRYAKKNMRSVISHSILMLGVINFSIFIFYFIMDRFLSVFIYQQHLFQFKLVTMHSTLDAVYNACTVFLAFMVTNLLFAPIVKLGHRLLEYMRPDMKINNISTTDTVNDATYQSETTP